LATGSRFEFFHPRAIRFPEPQMRRHILQHIRSGKGRRKIRQKHEPPPQIQPSDPQFLSIDEHSAPVPGGKPRETAQQRRLPGTVHAENRRDGTRGYGQTDSIKYPARSKSLG
jgi:hypothetical protein